ncbi:hypothetical protein CsSME_00015076 [Camellia sinensis var. sinensis]
MAVSSLGVSGKKSSPPTEERSECTESAGFGGSAPSATRPPVTTGSASVVGAPPALGSFSISGSTALLVLNLVTLVAVGRSSSLSLSSSEFEESPMAVEEPPGPVAWPVGPEKKKGYVITKVNVRSPRKQCKIFSKYGYISEYLLTW